MLNRNNCHIMFKLPALAILVLASVALSPVSWAQTSESTSNVSEVNEDFDFPVTPDESHSRRNADGELLKMASQQPARFIGRTLRLENGKPVGTILNVRRKLDNLYVYLVVDATEYFNAPTTYAVAVRDVNRLEGESVIMELSEGMHVRGLTYYPEDYTEVDNNFPKEALPGAEN